MSMRLSPRDSMRPFYLDYTHSYFHADLPTVGDAVVFLRTLLPGKPIDEIYTVLGRAKQGKTERYRTIFFVICRNIQNKTAPTPMASAGW